MIGSLAEKGPPTAEGPTYTVRAEPRFSLFWSNNKRHHTLRVNADVTVKASATRSARRDDDSLHTSSETVTGALANVATALLITSSAVPISREKLMCHSAGETEFGPGPVLKISSSDETSEDLTPSFLRLQY